MAQTNLLRWITETLDVAARPLPPREIRRLIARDHKEAKISKHDVSALIRAHPELFESKAGADGGPANWCRVPAWRAPGREPIMTSKYLIIPASDDVHDGTFFAAVATILQDLGVDMVTCSSDEQGVRAAEFMVAADIAVRQLGAPTKLIPKNQVVPDQVADDPDSEAEVVVGANNAHAADSEAGQVDADE